MSLKTKLISSISAFVLVLALLVVGVFALRQETITLGGTINFQAKNVYAEITGTISGQENGPASLPKLEFSNGQTPDTSGWAKGDLVFDPNASPIQIQIAINVKNLSAERSLFVKVDDLIGAVTNLTKSVMVGAEDKEGAYVEVLPLKSVDYVISLSPTDEGESVTGEYNYLITLIDESETQDIEIQANPNMETLGSVSGGGTFDLGDTVTLRATRSGSNTFLAWATSTDPNTMEILSTSATYSFELTMDSPRTYYALFNKTTSIKQTVGNLIYTFYNEAKLASVTDASTSLSGALEIPSVVSNGENSYKVYSIGNNAFQRCSSLTSITIPEGVTSIGQYAFDGCSGLTSITIPEGVRSIGYYSFKKCSSLTSVTLPSTLTSIGSQAFYNCSGLEAFYGTGNSYFMIDDNRALVVDGGERLLAYAVANLATSYSIPEGVVSIGYYVFDDCSNLTSVTLPSTLTLIGNNAFYNCSSLTSITIPEGVTLINFGAFGGCSGLTSITLPSTLTSIGKQAFINCSRLTSITIPEGVTSIGSSAFSACSSLTSITIPEGVTSIENYTFQSCSNLTSITLPSTLTSIGTNAFQYCSRLTSITIPEGVTSIGNNAFIGCRGLEAFYGPGNSYYTIDDNRALIVDGGERLLAYAIANTSTSYTILEGVTSIGQSVFSNCSSLTSITLPSTLTSIGSYAFNGCSSLTSITIPEGVTSIESHTFYGCSGLTSITILEGVTSIGNSAFEGCSSLTSITLPSTLTSIGTRAFDGCSSLTSVTLPSKLTSIGGSAFSGCSGLTSITLPSSLTSISSNAFYGCSSLTEITINGNITTLDSDAFKYCTNLTKLTLGAGVTSLPSNLFSTNMLTNLNEIVVLGDLRSETFPSGTWVKDGEIVTSFTGAGTYTKQA